MDNGNEIRLKFSGKILTAVIITAVVVFLLTFIIFKYLPDQKRVGEINDYKKEIFDSMYCQYSCPLVDQIIQNETQLLPNQTCVQQCAGDVQVRQAQAATFSDSDLTSDSLFSDIESLITSCRNSSIDQSSQIPTLDNAKFFECVGKGLDDVKGNYGYLN